VRELIALFLSNLGRCFEKAVLRPISDWVTVRIMLAHALRGIASEPLQYHGWVVNLVLASEGFLVLIAGRRGGKPEDMGALVGALVRCSESRDLSMPPFQVVSPTGRFVAWGWRPDGRELSAREQSAVLSVVLKRRERTETWKDLN
jgi:hypothetical protein